MIRSIFFKTFGSSLLIIILLAVLILATAFQVTRKHYLDSQAQDLERLARALEPDVTAFLDRNALAEMETSFQKLEKQTQVRLTLLRPDGAVLADSEENPERMENHRFRPEVVQALEGRVGRSLRFSGTLRTEMLYIALPLSREGRTLAVLRVSSFARDINTILSALRWSIARTTMIFTALALILAFFISRSYTRPIRRMIETSGRIASGDFGAKVYLPNRDELGQLGASLNAMSDRISGLFHDLTAGREEVRGIIGSMEEGLIVIDADERVGLANQSFCRIFAIDSPEGKFYWEAVRNSGFIELVQKARQEKRAVLERLAVRDKTYLAHASFISYHEHVTVALHDITGIASVT